MELGLYSFAETPPQLSATGEAAGQLTVGPTPHDKVMRSLELFGTKVAPAVRKATG